MKIYAPGPAEDVFALGVTAYKLVTEQYPPSPQPLDPRFHVWKTEGPGPQPAHELNPLCSMELSALISRMLSRQPEARGSAHELAEAMEQAASEAGPGADAPLFPGRPPWPIQPAKDLPRRGSPEAPGQGDGAWLVAAGFVGAAVLGATWVLGAPAPVEEATPEPVSQQEEARDGGIVGLGESVLTAPVASHTVPPAGAPITLDMPDKPLPGQRRPDASGRCPGKSMFLINGGCWIRLNEDPKDCRRYDFYLHKGACYVPAPVPPRPATSEPMESRDGGG